MQVQDTLWLSQHHSQISSSQLHWLQSSSFHSCSSQDSLSAQITFQYTLKNLSIFPSSNMDTRLSCTTTSMSLSNRWLTTKLEQSILKHAIGNAGAQEPVIHTLRSHKIQLSQAVCGLFSLYILVAISLLGESSYVSQVSMNEWTASWTAPY